MTSNRICNILLTLALSASLPNAFAQKPYRDPRPLADWR